MSDNNVPDDTETVHRYEVTVEKQLIIYAPNAEVASQRALAHMGHAIKPTLNGSAPGTGTVKVVEVRELPTLLDESRSGIIDRGPGS
jgi:hypothetical protein